MLRFLAVMLTLIFTVAKLTGYFDYGWLIVFMPVILLIAATSVALGTAMWLAQKQGKDFDEWMK